MLHNGEDIQDVFLCEGWLVAAVKVILFYQDLEGGRAGEMKWRLIHEEEGGRDNRNDSYLDTGFD